MTAVTPQLDVRDLKTYFFTEDGPARAVDGVSFEIERGETLGLAGESGCGKSVTCLSILRLVSPPGKIVGGDIRLDGRNLLTLPEKEMRRVRWGEIAMIFQEPMTSLNPVFTIGNQITEVLRLHLGASRKKARARAAELLRQVHIPSAEAKLKAYPHELSGGMLQRVMIAMAIACNPSVLIADEPSTSLDVTTEAQIMELLRTLQAEYRMSMLLVTHNLALLAEVCDRIAVMYASRIVEHTTTRNLFASPLHPYTEGLLNCVPRLGASAGTRLPVIPGRVPDPLHLPGGCRFHPRCPHTVPRCRVEEPELLEVRPGHRVACHQMDAIAAARPPQTEEEPA